METPSAVGVNLIRMATLYLMTSLLLGMVMAISKDYSLMSVHSHLGLLGWMGMTLTGIVYLVLPRCATTKLATAHFWLHSAGLPLMILGLVALVKSGDERIEAIIGVGASLVILGLLAFTVNVLKNAMASAGSGSRLEIPMGR
jgi:hypothetical protein